MRDARINMIYEGTNTDPVARPAGPQGAGRQRREAARSSASWSQAFVEEEGVNEAMQEFVNPLADLGDKVTKLTIEIGMKAFQNPDEVGAAAVDYLRVRRPLVFAYFLARMAKIALAQKQRLRRPVLQGQAGHRALLLRQACCPKRRMLIRSARGRGCWTRPLMDDATRQRLSRRSAFDYRRIRTNRSER